MTCNCQDRCYIPVDNERARAVFTQALADVDALMPEALKRAEAADTEDGNKAHAEYERQEAAYMRGMEAWMLEMEQWNARWLFKGPEPMRPWMPRPFPRFCWMQRKATLEDARNRVQTLRDIAFAASGPYMMNEQDAARLIAWENGQALRLFKAQWLGE